MSAESASSHETDDIPELGDSPGRHLRLTRQAKGMEIGHVAAELHLSPSKIEALEQDDYDALPDDVFVVGYIRKYARVVGLDPEPLVDVYHSVAPRSVPSRPRKVPRRSPGTKREVRSSHWIVRLISVAILILLAVLTFDWWQSRPPADQPAAVDLDAEPETMEPALPEPDQVPQTSASVAPEVTTAPSAPPPPEEEPSARTEAPLEEPAPAAAGQQQPATPSADAATETSGTDEGSAADAESPAAVEDDEKEAAADIGEILMTFDGPCWVDVRDSERKYKLFGEMKKGDRHVLEGKPPYSVILGNAAAVKISIDGESFDLSAISRGNVARFTLDPSKLP